MRISILSIFPDFFGTPFAEGMIRLAREKEGHHSKPHRCGNPYF